MNMLSENEKRPKKVFRNMFIIPKIEVKIELTGFRSISGNIFMFTLIRLLMASIIPPNNPSVELPDVSVVPEGKKAFEASVEQSITFIFAHVDAFRLLPVTIHE
ncbi:MAG: hypothetical protein QXL17_07875 [Candidatus Thermoplasmatota archaeon]